MKNERDLSNEPPPYEPIDPASILCLQPGTYEMHRTSERLLKRIALTGNTSQPVFYSIKASSLLSKKDTLFFGLDKELGRIEWLTFSSTSRIIIPYDAGEHTIEVKRTKTPALYPNYRFEWNDATYEWQLLVKGHRIAQLRIMADALAPPEFELANGPITSSNDIDKASGAKNIGDGTTTAAVAATSSTEPAPLAVLTMKMSFLKREKRLEASEMLHKLWQDNRMLQHVIVATALVIMKRWFEEEDTHAGTATSSANNFVQM